MVMVGNRVKKEEVEEEQKVTPNQMTNEPKAKKKGSKVQK